MTTQKITVEGVELELPISEKITVDHYRGSITSRTYAIVIFHYPNLSKTSILILSEKVYEHCKEHFAACDEFHVKTIFFI